MIKYGDVEYFTLLSLQDKLRSWDYDKLDLANLDKLRLEIEIKVATIHEAHKSLKLDKTNP